LRLSEAIALQTTDLDRARMQLRVRHGKGANYAKVVVMQRSSSGGLSVRVSGVSNLT
jgi:hypothetical protein